jgi:hypothetical protein
MDWHTGSNPWAPGGRMTAKSPWAQQGMLGMQHGWQQAGGFFTPKSDAQIRREGLMQLAILAAVVVAPALLGAGGAAGGASAGGAAAGGGATAGAGTASGTTAGVAATTQMVEGATLIGSAATTAAGTSGLVTAGAASAATASAALLPFTGVGALAGLLGAAAGGAAALNQALQQRAPAARPSFVFDPGNAAPELDKDGRHPALPMLENVAYELKREPSLAAKLRMAAMSNQLPRLSNDRQLISLVAKALAEVGPTNPWAGDRDTPSLSTPFIQVDAEEEEEDDELINVALFPSLRDVSGDDVMNEAYLGLKLANPDPEGVQGWKVLHASGGQDSIKKLAKFKIRNLVIFSHGEYDRGRFSLGSETVTITSIERLEFDSLSVKNIILFSCFVANTELRDNGIPIMLRLAQLTNAKVYGNEGYSYPERLKMWNSANEIRFVIAGVDTNFKYSEKPYILDGAGKWLEVSPSGDKKPIATVYLNRDGTCGYLVNSWRDYEKVAPILDAAKAGLNDYPINDMGGSTTIISGRYGELVPPGGGVLIQ